MGNEALKPWWFSKTILSCLGILIVAVLSFFGVQASDADGAAFADAVEAIVTGVLAITGIYGRIAARHKIG